ncbi:MAG TPA: hypothetical protein VEI47_03895 [Gemmatimonadales bacterium]|nr:hypothetical protein [Gemmatimonadales bacterium]
MTHGEPFDSQPDPVLGELLRRHLAPQSTDAAFADRVLARLPQRGSLWEVLARWARPGIAAAALIGALLGYWLVLHAPGPETAEPGGELAATGRPLNSDAMMSVVLGNNR